MLSNDEAILEEFTPKIDQLVRDYRSLSRKHEHLQRHIDEVLSDFRHYWEIAKLNEDLEKLTQNLEARVKKIGGDIEPLRLAQSRLGNLQIEANKINEEIKAKEDYARKLKDGIARSLKSKAKVAQILRKK